MTKRNPEKRTQKGSIMIEALALLGLITMVTPILYRKAAERATELQDINIATQLRMISNAVDGYIQDNYSEISSEHSGDTVFTLSDDELNKVKQYLPEGVNMDPNRLFSSYDIGVIRNAVTDREGNTHNIYTSGVLAALAENFTMMRSSKIASMIGANGGVYRTSGEDGASGEVTGVQGIWSAGLADYGLDSVNPKNGSLMVISSEAISASRGDASSDEVLYRVAKGGGKNTMQTTLSMGGNPIVQVTQLVASADDVTIGDNSNSSNLIVKGTSNLIGAVTADNGVTVSAGDLNVTSGATKLGGTLDVTKATTLNDTLDVAKKATLKDELEVAKKATLKNDLEVQQNTALKGTLDVTKATKLNDTLDVAKKTTLSDELEVAKKATLKDELEVQGNTALKGTLDVTGATTLNGATTVKNTLLVTNDATFKQDVTIEGALKANWLKAISGITVGPDYNGNIFYVDNTKTKINATNSINLATTAGDTALQMSSGGIQMVVGSAVDAKVTNDSIDLTAGNVAMNLSDTESSWRITNGESVLSSKDSYLRFVSTDDTSSSDMRVDATGFALSKSGDALGSANAVTDSTAVTNTAKLNDKAAVAISRKGIVDVTGGDAASGGNYIKARRLVSDVLVPTDDAYTKVLIAADQDDYSNPSADKSYAYYEVNPAYTSVMNDIKLTTRGGARLSDILPDFINKGIYVLDNTYDDSAVKLQTSDTQDWPKHANGKVVSEPTSCASANCVASPWLGFVPTPQCPRNYARAITLNPIRWRMSEVFAVYNTDGWSSNVPSDYSDIISGSKFGEYFAGPRNPRTATFGLSGPEGEMENHTHELTEGYPMTFQTNTFLNTTISTTEDSAKTFQGWDVVMGFIYRPKQYADLLRDLGITVDSSKVYWNVFPVYAQTMAAYATVYCYFDRHPRNASGTRYWTWGNAGPVYDYDQLDNFHLGYNKGSWKQYVNDPALGYDDAW